MRMLMNNYRHAVIVIVIAFSSGEVNEAKTLTECCTHSKLRQPSPLSHPLRWSLSAEAIIFDRVGTAKYALVERVPGP
jgi:hypothetical protein